VRLRPPVRSPQGRAAAAFLTACSAHRPSTNLSLVLRNLRSKRLEGREAGSVPAAGGFRSLEGAVDFAVVRSFISTAKKQGWNIIQALSQDAQILTGALGIT
jgi:hypothetical protein